MLIGETVEGVYGNSVLSAQYFYKSKTALKLTLQLERERKQLQNTY